MTRHLTVVALLGLIAGCAEPTESAHPATSDPPDVDPAYPPAMIEAKFESGGSVLSGLVYVANGPGPHPTTVFLHGFPGNERNLDLAQALRRAGTNAVYFTYRGAWGNGGAFSAEHALEDAAALLATVRDSGWAARTRSDPEYLTPMYAADLASRPLLVVAGTRDQATPKEVHHDPFVAALAESDADRVTEAVYDDDHSFSAHRVELARRLVDWQAAECW